MKNKLLVITGLFFVIIFCLGMITSLGKVNALGDVGEISTPSLITPEVSTSLSMKTNSNDIAGKLLWSNTAAWTSSSLSVTDFNNDGIDDILAGDRDPRALNGATGATLWVYLPPNAGIGTTAVGDFNNDGTDDALVGNWDNDTYAINGATGGLLWQYATNDQIGAVSVGDFNNDGTDDALIGSWDTNVYALNGADGTQLWNNTDPNEAVLTMVIGDVNGDNIDDAIIGCNTGDAAIYAIDGLTGVQLWNNTDPTYWITSIVVLDFNKDGNDDVIAGETAFDVYFIDGITGVTSWTSAIPSAYLALGDFNNDGFDDVAAASSNNNLYALEASTGEIQWINSDSSDSLRRIAIGDVNGDGLDDVITGGDDSNVYAVSGLNGALLWKNTDPDGFILDLQLGNFNEDDTLDVVVSSYGSIDRRIYVITGYTPPTTQLEVTLVLSKTYVNLTNDWTIARVVVTNVGAFPAHYVFVLIYTPDGFEDLMGLYDTILPSRSKQSRWNLTSGSGLPTTKVVNALEVSYTVSVLVGSYNTPMHLVSTPIIVDPPLDEIIPQEELQSDNYPSPPKFLIGSFAMGMIVISFVGALGALGFGFYKKRHILFKNHLSGD